MNDLRVGTVKDPEIVDPHDAIVRVSLSTTCGSDLHFIDGYIPTMKAGDVIGHEFMGVIEDVGPEVKRVAKGDRVVVPSFIVCGQCWYCQRDLYSLCDNSHPKPKLQAPLLGGYQTAGIYGYTHAFGGYAGSHAEYIRVPSPTTTASNSLTGGGRDGDDSGRHVRVEASSTGLQEGIERAAAGGGRAGRGS